MKFMFFIIREKVEGINLLFYSLLLVI